MNNDCGQANFSFLSPPPPPLSPSSLTPLTLGYCFVALLYLPYLVEQITCYLLKLKSFQNSVPPLGNNFACASEGKDIRLSPGRFSTTFRFQ